MSGLVLVLLTTAGLHFPGEERRMWWLPQKASRGASGGWLCSALHHASQEHWLPISFPSYRSSSKNKGELVELCSCATAIQEHPQIAELMGQEHLQLGLLNGGLSHLASAGVAGIHVN